MWPGLHMLCYVCMICHHLHTVVCRCHDLGSLGSSLCSISLDCVRLCCVQNLFSGQPTWQNLTADAMGKIAGFVDFDWAVSQCPKGDCSMMLAVSGGDPCLCPCFIMSCTTNCHSHLTDCQPCRLGSWGCTCWWRNMCPA